MADDKSLTQEAAQQVKSTLSKNKHNKDEDVKVFKERNQDLEWQDSSNAKNCFKCDKKFRNMKIIKKFFRLFPIINTTNQLTCLIKNDSYDFKSSKQLLYS